MGRTGGGGGHVLTKTAMEPSKKQSDTVTDTVEGAELQDPPLTDMLPQAFSLSAMWFRADWCNSGQFES